MESLAVDLAAGLFFSLILIVPLWKIFRKTGKAPALAFFAFVPVIGFLVVTLILAFSRWPSVNQLDKGAD